MVSQLKEHRKEHAQRYFYCWPTCVETSDNEDAV